MVTGMEIEHQGHFSRSLDTVLCTQRLTPFWQT